MPPTSGKHMIYWEKIQYLKCENAAVTGTRANKPLLYWEEKSVGKSEENSDRYSILFTGEVIEFDIWEGNVTVLWDPPEGAPVHALYQVKQAP